MPSNKNPITSVNSGPGRVPANSVDSSALTFPVSGGGDLNNHLADPLDAHMASAIGIPANHPITNDPLLASVGGPYDGESVLDALAALKDLLPVRPDRLGFNNAVVNSGIPSWGTALTAAVHGGWTDTTAGPTAIVSKNLVSSTGAQTISGVLYPADRGVIALYQTTSGVAPDFTVSGQTTLVAALWLGASPAPAGLASANFVESTRGTSQTNYTASGSGLDKISLIDRLPYLSNYPGLQYTAFPSNFSAYQLGKFSTSVTLSTGDNDSYLLVHWKEGYATTLTAIQPAALAAGLNTSNVYSALPSDGSNYDNVVRFNIYSDASQGTGPTGGVFTSAPVGTTSTTAISGVLYYNNTGLQFDITETATNLFADSYVTNTVTSASVLSGYTSSVAPCVVNTSIFGGISTPYQLFDASPARLTDNSNVAFHVSTNPPAIGSVAKFRHATHPIGGTGLGIPDPRNSTNRVQITWNDPFSHPSTITDSTQYLYLPGGLPAYDPSANSGLGATPGDNPSTTSYDSFVDETYRYTLAYSLPNSAARIDPSLNAAGAGDYDSTIALGAPVADEGDLQVMAGKLVYPKDDFLAGAIRPVQSSGRDYSSLGDTLSVTVRRYMRAFNTSGGPTGALRITGLAYSTFQAVSNSGNVFTDYTGGAIIQVRASDTASWLSLGRQAGSGDGALNVASPTTDGTTGELILPYLLPGSGTVVNGSSEFPLFVRITFLDTVAGNALTLSSLRWRAS